MTEDYHAYAAPQLAPGGDWIAYGTTGSDVSVTYHVLDLADEYTVPWFEMWMATPVAMAWAPASPLLALGGEVVGAARRGAGIYVADAAGGAMGADDQDLLTQGVDPWIMDMDWSDGGKIVADGLIRKTSTSEDETRVLLLDSATSARSRTSARGTSPSG